MELNDKVNQLEDEIKILKNEVHAILLDLRESYLNRENPFNPDASTMANQPPNTKGEGEQGDTVTSEKEESELPGAEEQLVNEPEPSHKQELTASEETAREEVKRAWRPEIDMGSSSKPGETADSSDGKVHLATIHGLAQWVAETTKRLGCERTKAILDISEVMGYVPLELKSILDKFINHSPDDYTGKATTRDYLASLIELNSLLGKVNKSEAVLLSILCQEDNHR